MGRVVYEGFTCPILRQHSFPDGVRAVYVAVIANPTPTDARPERYVIVYEEADHTRIAVDFVQELPGPFMMEVLYFAHEDT